MEITSKSFNEGERIPEKYTCEGIDANPDLEFHDIPENTKSLVLFVEDPDAPQKTWIHWVVFNIPPEVTSIPENSVPKGVQATNDFKKLNYGGPCPPSGEHRYLFKLYALDKTLSVEEDASVKEIKDAMENHVLEQASLTGVYSRKKL